MSELALPPPRPSFDFLKPLAFVFEDKRWIEKIIYGALFTLASIVIVGIFFVYGYLARLVRNVVDGVEHPLPEWTDLGDMFQEGFFLFLVSFFYMLPLWFLMGFYFAFGLLAGSDSDAAHIIGSCGIVLLMLILVPLGLVLAVWLPAALVFAAVRRDFRAGFDFRAIAAFLRHNAINYLLAYLDWLVSRMATPLGFLLCCVGVFATSFWSLCVGTYAFAQAYRMQVPRS